MNRRFFLHGLGYLTLGTSLTSCQANVKHQFRVALLRQTIPVQLLRTVKDQLSSEISLNVSVKSNESELYGQLQTWQEQIDSKRIAQLNMVGLGDYWLTQAIRAQLIEPLSLSKSELSPLSARWQSLVRRDSQGTPSPEGKIWAAPYCWGATLLVYRKDKLKSFDWELEDWSDLWRSDLQGRIGLLNQPREVLGMVLKSMGLSYNEAQPDQVDSLRQKLQSLDQQTKVYSSQNYLQPLILGDVWVAMGWSSDILPALAQDNNLAVVFPRSGTAVWADLWVKSRAKSSIASTHDSDILNRWITYWWQRDVADKLSLFSNTSSVVVDRTLAQNTSNPAVSLLSSDHFDRSEFLLPLTESSLKAYQSLWLEMRQTR